MSNQGIARSTGRAAWPWWMVVALVLVACQPFLSVHFDDEGLVPGQGINVRSADGPVQFLPDADAAQPMAFETKLFVPVAAGIHLPGALSNGIAAFLGLVLMLSPLRVTLPGWLTRLVDSGPGRSMQNRGGAPPKLPRTWSRQPPIAAPPR